MSTAIKDGIDPSLDLNSTQDQVSGKYGKALNDANAAPEVLPADRQSFWRIGIYIGVLLFGMLASFISGVVWYKSARKESPIERVAPAVQVAPPAAAIAPTKQPPKKATKPAVEPAMPTTVSIPPVVLPVAVKPEPEPLTDFDKRVLNFETRVINLESKP